MNRVISSSPTISQWCELTELAKDNSTMYRLAEIYETGQFNTWEKFLFQSLLIIVTENNNLRTQLTEKVSHQNPLLC